jgi:hypothetical protein
METSRLEIGCAAIKYLVPARHPAPLRVRDRLDGVIERELPQTVARAFDSWFSDNDPSIWIVQQLNIDVALNIGGEPAQISRQFAAQLACHLSKALQEGDHNNVRHFRSRAEYLASFLADLASGCAWSQWYYESFSGLKPLPVPVALRTAICNDVVTGKSALALLPPVELQQVLHQLSSQDARRILEQFAEEETAFEEALCRETVARAMSANLVGLTRLADEWRRALYLFIIVVARETTQAGGAPLRDAVVAAAKLADRLSGASAAESEKLIAAYARNGAPFRSPADAAAQMGTNWRTTAFGEIFLLLPCLDEMPLSEATRDWPATDGLAAVSLARWLVLLKCCGRGQSAHAFYDPLLRDLLSIPLAVSPETLRAWQARLTPKHLEDFLAALIEWQSSRGAIEGKEQLIANVTQSGTPPELVLIDGARGLWLRVDRHLARKPQKIIRSLRASLHMMAEQEGILYSDPSLVPLLRENLPQLNVVDLSDRAAAPAEAETCGIDALIARLDKLQDDLKFLRLPTCLKIARPLDRALSIAAQQLLRGLAWRLPGFAGSNLPYLSRNFLEFAATIEADDARHIVRIGRPPLHLILSMTGMTRQSYRLSWRDERPFALFQQE